MEADHKVNNYIQDVLFMDGDEGETVISLRKLVLAGCPKSPKNENF